VCKRECERGEGGGGGKGKRERGAGSTAPLWGSGDGERNGMGGGRLC
jgi:hypothetical protein